MHASVETRKLSLSDKEGKGVSRDGDLPEMLTARDLEGLMKIDVKTIYSYVQKGLIPYVKIQSNVRFRLEEILEWIDQQSYQPRVERANGTRKE